MINQVTAKICTKCGCNKNFSEYSRQKTGKYGLQPKCKSCNAEYKAAHYQANKAKIAANQVKYHKANKAKIAARTADYYEINKTKIADYQADYYKINKTAIAAKTAEWQKTPKGKLASKAIRHKRRLSAKANTHPLTHATKLEIELLIDLQCNKCLYCECEISINENAHLDHILPLSRKGSNDILNMQFLCSSCNLKKNNKTEIEYLGYGFATEVSLKRNNLHEMLINLLAEDFKCTT